MWGEPNPAERLRAITHRGYADDVLAIEAAEALAGFAAEPAHLVVACRRLLAHHPAHGVLWWVCARVLAAADPVSAAREAARLIGADRTAGRIAAALPLVGEATGTTGPGAPAGSGARPEPDEPDEVVGVVGWPPAVDEALAERRDVPAVALRVVGADPVPAVRRRRADRTIRVADPWDPALTRVRVLLVRASAIGPGGGIVPEGTGELLEVLGPAVRETWLVGGVGRVLPGRLFDALRSAVGDAETVALDRVDRVAGPRGVEAPLDAAARSDCPVVPELLRPLTV